MAVIETISPGRASGETARAYAYLAEVMGSDALIARVVQLFSLRAASMRRMEAGRRLKSCTTRAMSASLPITSARYA